MKTPSKVLIQQLRDCSHMMPDGGSADPTVEVLAGLAAEAADAIEKAEAKARRFRDHLDRRPALNAGLDQAYAEWTGRMYLVDQEGHVREPEALIAAMRRRV